MGSFQLSNTLRRERRQSEKSKLSKTLRALTVYVWLSLQNCQVTATPCCYFCASNSQSTITFRVLSGVSSMMSWPVVEQRRNSIGGLRKTTRTCKNMRLDSAD